VAPGRTDIEPVQVAGNSLQGLALAAPPGHDRQNIGRGPVGMMGGKRQRPRRLDARNAYVIKGSVRLTITSMYVETQQISA
jgi:hypothetical protein